MNMNPERSSRSVFIGNIPYETTEEQLKEIFSQAGTITSLRLVYDRETGKPKGYGFCEYVDLETAQSAMRNLNNHEFKGRQLRVGIASGDMTRGEERGITGPIIENPYGEPVEPEQAPEAISRAVASLPPEQMFELMKQMKLCIQNNPAEARNMLLQNPQLAYALLQAQIVMKIVDPKVAMAMLHRQSDQIPPPASAASAPLLSTPVMKPLVSVSTSQQLPFLDHMDTPTMLHRQPDPIPAASAVSAPLLSTPPGMKPLVPSSVPQQPLGAMGPAAGIGSGMAPARPINSNAMAPRPNMVSAQMTGPDLNNQRMPFPGGGDPRQRGPSPHELMSRPVGQPNMMGGGPRPRGPEMVRSHLSSPKETFESSVRGSLQPDIQDPRSRPMGPRDMMQSRPRGPSPQDQPMGPRARGPTPQGADNRLAGPLDPRAQRMKGAVAAGPPRQQVPGGGNQEQGAAQQGTNAQLNQQEQEKAALIMQVLQLSDEQIQMLPPDQRQSILILKEQIARSSMQQIR